jgi:formate dehydrogenase beta subunit
LISQRHPGSEARAGRFPGPSFIPDLHQIQREHGWLPREELVKLSRDRRWPLYEIEGLISFYPHFRTAPPPETEIACCHDPACWVHGSEDRIDALHTEHDGDANVQLREVPCIGRCDRAPAVSTETGPGGRFGRRLLLT